MKFIKSFVALGIRMRGPAMPLKSGDVWKNCPEVMAEHKTARIRGPYHEQTHTIRVAYFLLAITRSAAARGTTA